MLAPIVLFVYNRPEHTRKTLEALSKNTLASKSLLYIFSDYAKNQDVLADVLKTREIIKNSKIKSAFKQVEIFESNENKGLANSVIFGVSDLINKFGKVIVIEDDLITSSNFLEFMNDSLVFYKENDLIWSISGYSLPITISENYSHDIYLTTRGSSWGWATWKDRWNQVDWGVPDYLEFKKNKKLRRKFNRGGRDLSRMLDKQMCNQIDSWAIRWCYAQFRLGMYTVYPRLTKVKNIGIDGSGTHSGKSDKYAVKLIENQPEYKLEHIRLDKMILKRFSKFYLSNFDVFKIIIKEIFFNISNYFINFGGNK